MDARQARIEAIKAELTDPRLMLPMDKLAKELAGMGSTIVDRPAGTEKEWYAAIYALVESKYLTLLHGTHVQRNKSNIEVAPVVEQPKPKPKPTQMELF